MDMRVLIATDGSEAAGQAIDLAAAMKWPAGTQLRLVAVVEPAQPIISADWIRPNEDSASYPPEAQAKARSVLENAAARLERDGIDVSCRLMHGRPANEVLKNAHDFAVDLIIVGSRGHGTIASMILGSVSSEIADHAPCPVLVARRPYLTRLVLGVDGSSFARVAEDFIAMWPVFADVTVEVVSVEPSSSNWAAEVALGGYLPPAELDAALANEVAEHRAICEASSRRLRDAGRVASVRVAHGAAAVELMRTAVETQADLIVVGTQGRSGVSRVVYGSVARNVMLHAPCSVLVVRELAHAIAEAAA
jgi:nucleotide-binding universal stress UspA family protein